MSHLLPHLPAGDGDITAVAGGGYQNVYASDAIGPDATIHPTSYSSVTFSDLYNCARSDTPDKVSRIWKVINKNMLFVVKICLCLFFVEILITISQERTTTGKAINQYAITKW